MAETKRKLKVAGIVQPTPLQRAFWIYSGGPGPADPGTLVVRFSISCALNDTIVTSAWNATIAQHEMLRASLNPDKQHEPLLVVREKLQQDIIRLTDNITPPISIRLDRAPTHQLHCYPDSGSGRMFVWHCHHALLDGWSAQIVLQDFIRNYEALQRDDSFIPVSHDYLSVHRQLQHKDNSSSKDFWQANLAGFTQPLLLTHSASAGHTGKRSVQHAQLLDADAATKLNRLCKDSKVTAATTIQAIWASFLGQLCQKHDVVIGVAVSGRPATIANIESTVGCFASVAPTRLRLNPDHSFENHLQTLQKDLFHASEHQHIGLLSILEQAEAGSQSKLFDTLLVIENYPLIGQRDNGGLGISDFSSDIVSAYPLTVTVIPGQCYTLRCDYSESRFSNAWIESMLQALSKLAEHYILNWTKPIATLQQQPITGFPAHPDTRAMTIRNAQDVLRDTLFDTLKGARNHTELEIVSIWEDTLQLRPVSLDDPFFNIGGTSLQAIQLIDRIEKRFGYRLPASLFLDNPTPEICARVIAENGTGTTPIQSLVALKESGDAAPLFCLHAGGGHAMFYRSFAHKLPANIPCYAIQPRGIDGQEPPLTDLSEMAAHYIAEIKTRQPNGPYHLLCYCFGGALLLEMAHQFTRNNDNIGHLIVADAPAPVPASHPMAKLGWRAFLLYEFAIQGRWDMLAQASRTWLKKYRYAKSRNSDSHDTGMAQNNTLAEVQKACVRSFNNYRAQPTKLTLTFLNAGSANENNSSTIYMRNWSTLAPNRQTYHLDGDHRFIFDQPHVAETAKMIATILTSPTPNATLITTTSDPARDTVPNEY